MIEEVAAESFWFAELHLRDKNGFSCNPLPGQMVRGKDRLFTVDGVGWKGERRVSFDLIEYVMPDGWALNGVRVTTGMLFEAQKKNVEVAGDMFERQIREGAMVWHFSEL